MNILQQSESADFDFPGPRNSYSYWVHDADGNRYYRDEWTAFRTLIDAVRTVRAEYPVAEKLEDLRATGIQRLERDDIIWFEIVLSLATLRGSYGAQLVLTDNGEIDEHRYGSVAFRTLEQVDPDHRSDYLEARLYGNVPMHPTKAEALESNFQRIKDKYGDPQGSKAAFEQHDGPEAKLDFLRQFDWIGDKYARNILMDLYHEDAREFIAVDSRITGLLETAGYPAEKRSYEDKEAFLQSVAAEVGIDPWDLDRTLYNFESEIRDVV